MVDCQVQGSSVINDPPATEDAKAQNAKASQLGLISNQISNPSAPVLQKQSNSRNNSTEGYASASFPSKIQSKALRDLLEAKDPNTQSSFSAIGDSRTAFNVLQTNLTSNPHGTKENTTSLGRAYGQEPGMIVNLNAPSHMSNTGADLVEFLRLNSELLNQPVQSQTTYAQESRLNQVKDQNTQPAPKEPVLYIKLKEENEMLKAKAQNLALQLEEEAKSNSELQRKREQLHKKLENKDKSISKLRTNLRQLKDDINLVNESISQIKRSTLYIKTEDEHLQELTKEMLILLDDCLQKTTVREDDKGNISIGALTFLDEELLLINAYNQATNSQVATTEQLLHEIQISLEQKISVLQASHFNAVDSRRFLHKSDSNERQIDQFLQVPSASKTAQFGLVSDQPSGAHGYSLAPTNTKKVNKTSTKSAATKHKVVGQVQESRSPKSAANDEDQSNQEQKKINQPSSSGGGLSDTQDYLANVSDEEDHLNKQAASSFASKIQKQVVPQQNKQQSDKKTGLQDPGSVANLHQPIMFVNPSQNALFGSSLHEVSSKQFQIQDNKGRSKPGMQVTDTMVEGLKRDIKIYIDKCSMLVASCKQSQQESQERARHRDEQIIDLEFKLSEQSQTIESMKEENEVLSIDCHRLLSKLEVVDHAQIEDNEFKQRAQMTEQNLKATIKQQEQQIRQAREDFKNLNKLRREETEHRLLDVRQFESQHGKQVSNLNAQLAQSRHNEEKLLEQFSQVKQQLIFEKEESKYQVDRLQNQLAEAEKKSQIQAEKAENAKVQEYDSIQNYMTDELRALKKEVQALKTQLNQSETKRILFEDIAKKDQSINAKTLMGFLGYIFRERPRVDPQRFAMVKELFDKHSFKVIESYEAKIGNINRMNSALVSQLKDWLVEMQQVFLKEPSKLKQLQEQDKVLQHIILEEHTNENVFEWIKDFKDSEIRQQLKRRIKELEKELRGRDQEIVDMQLKMEDMVMNVERTQHEESYQSGGATTSIRQRGSRQIELDQSISAKSSQLQQQHEYKLMMEKETETIALIEDLKEALKEKEAELADVKNELVTIKNDVDEKEQRAGVFELQVINCQATLLEELLRTQ